MYSLGTSQSWMNFLGLTYSSELLFGTIRGTANPPLNHKLKGAVDGLLRDSKNQNLDKVDLIEIKYTYSVR